MKIVPHAKLTQLIVKPHITPKPTRECPDCYGTGVERHDRGLGERCSTCKGKG